ncbi:MAG: PepSY domain-containing protein [Porticoccaceae bacterium]|jgi:uncharacterized membrane protein YkoI|nr:PepSY domain-containing protein [Porticoccaceae bacterium]MEA3300566.1 PepSY domain-containing protein [Pseudomonadota bacterium]HLS98128.1 PepSY domain-containing protein [Porticoccaceae bacterium]
MKPITSLLLAATFTTAAAFSVFADDLGPDKAIELVEQGTIKHFRDLNKIASDLHPGATIVDTELEDEYGKFVYKLELRDSANTEWEVAIDAQSGAVLKNRQDNDD